MLCTRCGRRSHSVSTCFAERYPNGERISSRNCFYSYDSSEEEEGIESGVYILQSRDKRYYVGKSDDVQSRIEAHMQGNGAKCVEDWGKLCRACPMTKRQPNDLEAWERNETLSHMKQHGIDNVRGWMFVSKSLTDEQREDAFKQVCERFDLCRKCGRDSHFADSCFAKTRAAWAQ